MSAEITKETLNEILKDLGKEYRKRGGKQMPAEIVMTGGAAIIAKYGFRDKSYDIDAIIRASSALQDAVLTVLTNIINKALRNNYTSSGPYIFTNVNYYSVMKTMYY